MNECSDNISFLYVVSYSALMIGVLSVCLVISAGCDIHLVDIWELLFNLISVTLMEIFSSQMALISIAFAIVKRRFVLPYLLHVVSFLDFKLRFPIMERESNE